jgi:hypothetical protein
MDEKSVATTNPLVVAEVEQNKRAQEVLTPEEYEIFLKVSGRTKDYPDKDKFYASLSEDERRIFNKGMTAARKDGGRRRTRRGNILSRLYNKMTHTRKHRGGTTLRMPHEHRIIALRTIYGTAAQKAKNKAWQKELAEKKAEKARKHAEAMANPRRSARLAAKKRSGGRRTRRNRK